MKKLLPLFIFCAIAQFAYADGNPVLKVELKGGFLGRVDAIITDMKDHKGAASLAINAIAQTLSNINYEDMEVNPDLNLDITDYKVSNELLSFAKDEISKNHLTGEIKKEVIDFATGCKRVYVLTWSSRNKYGDSGSINISKLDQTATCSFSYAA